MSSAIFANFAISASASSASFASFASNASFKSSRSSFHSFNLANNAVWTPLDLFFTVSISAFITSSSSCENNSNVVVFSKSESNPFKLDML